MNFLILGSGGQLGRAISQCQMFANDSLYLYDKNMLDITDRDGVLSFFLVNKIDVIINCAAFTNVDLCEKMRNEAFTVNYQGTINVSEAAKQHDVVMIHISTDFVFNGEKEFPYSESDLTGPLNYYGVTKLMSEDIVRNIVPKHFVVRTSSMYSRNGNNFVKSVVKKALSSNEITVVNDQISCPTNADDLAEALYKLITTEKYGTYHIANEGYCSKFEFAQFILNCCGLTAKIKPCKSADFLNAAARPRFSALNCNKYSVTTGENLPFWQDSAKKFLYQNKDLYERT